MSGGASDPSWSRQGGVPLCPRCGVIAPSEAQGCALCGQAFGYPRTISPGSSDGTFWVAVRASFQCRSCSFLSPIDELDVDGSVECAQCAMQQRFDLSAWDGALAFAHAIGDLAYPPPEGRHPDEAIWIADDNPYQRVGYTQPFDEHRQSSTYVENGVHIHRSLFLQAGPGHPVCATCEEPLHLRIPRKGEVRAECRSCGESSSYSTPPGGFPHSASLVAVVGPEHRSDRKMATMELTVGGPISLKCPECNAPLQAKPGQTRVLDCGYCSASVWIPARAVPRSPGQVAQPAVWWVAFRGPSAARRELEHPPLEATEAGADGKKGLEALKKIKAESQSSLDQAPKSPGTHWAQLLFSTTLILLALAVGFVLHLVAEKSLASFF